jgi:2-succinyl-5-enolpyruvyl-6-hydroxy-3-cyclohexene-1-carboxylate synthase
VSRWLGNLATGCIRMLIDADGMWHDPHVSASHLLVADPIALCTALCTALSQRIEARDGSPHRFTRAWLERAAVAREIVSQHADDGLWEGRIASELTRALPSGAQLWTASSMPIRDVDSFGGATRQTITVRANRGTNGIDGTIASAAGAAKAWSGGGTIALLGDLAFLHDLGGLEAAARLGVDLCLVVINNGGGGIFSFLPVAGLDPARFERFFVTPQACHIGNLCLAVGAGHERVDVADELHAAIARGVGGTGLRILEVVVDREDNVRRHDRVWADVARAFDEIGASTADRAPDTRVARQP